MCSTGGPRIVRILGSQGMVLLEKLCFEKKKAKTVLYRGIRTIPGIVLSEIVLSGDPLYLFLKVQLSLLL